MASLKSLAHALDGDVVKNCVLAPGPGHSKTDRSMQVSIDPTVPSGVRVHSWAGDDWRDCLTLVQERLGGGTRWHTSTAAETYRHREVASDNNGRAMDLWTTSRPPQGTPVETYFAGRGLALPAGSDALRFHPACPFRLDDGSTARLPAMLGLMRDILTDQQPCGIHRTALRADGSGKADVQGLGNPKKMLGRAKGACIKLSPDEAVTDGLGIAEGIETALTALTNGWAPIWACGSAGSIAHFPVLAGIECLTIFADADPAGVKAARACRARWQGAGMECTVILPPEDGQDWNDIMGPLL